MFNILMLINVKCDAVTVQVLFCLVGAGFDRNGYDRHGYNRHGYSRYGYDRDGYNRHGYNRRGLDRHGNQDSGNIYNEDGEDCFCRTRQGKDLSRISMPDFSLKMNQ